MAEKTREKMFGFPRDDQPRQLLPRLDRCGLVKRVSGKPTVRGTRVLADTIARDFECGSPQLKR